MIHREPLCCALLVVWLVGGASWGCRWVAPYAPTSARDATVADAPLLADGHADASPADTAPADAMPGGDDGSADGADVGAADSAPPKELITSAQQDLQESHDPNDARAPLGVLTIDATVTNLSSSTYTALHFEVIELEPPNVLLNADAGAGGVGARLTVPDAALGTDGSWSPGESFVQTFEVGVHEFDAQGKLSVHALLYGALVP